MHDYLVGSQNGTFEVVLPSSEACDFCPELSLSVSVSVTQKRTASAQLFNFRSTMSMLVCPTIHNPKHSSENIKINNWICVHYT